MTSGIYAIFNTCNGKSYVGSSKHIRNRWYCHKQALRQNRHVNKHLQYSWNKYKESTFEFIILDILPLEKLEKAEQYWVNKLKSRKCGYNIREVSSTNIGSKRSEESKALMKKVQIEYWKNWKMKNGARTPWNKNKRGCYSEEALENIRKGVMGQIVSPETRKKISDTFARKRLEKSLDGIPPSTTNRI